MVQWLFYETRIGGGATVGKLLTSVLGVEHAKLEALLHGLQLIYDIGLQGFVLEINFPSFPSKLETITIGKCISRSSKNRKAPEC